jgi:hypothetical protein
MNKGHVLRSQRSVRYATKPTPGTVAHPLRDFYMNMFMEDTSSGILPIGTGKRKKGAKVELVPPSRSVERLVIEAISRDLYGYRSDLTGAVAEFFRLCSATICADDEATHEIVYLEDRQAEKEVAFELVPIPQEQLIRRFGRTFQIVSPEAASELGVPSRIRLPDEGLLRFRAPVPFRNALRRMRRGLFRLGERPLIGMAMEVAEGKRQYDVHAHERARRLALLDTVKVIGWTARGDLRQNVLSFYWIQMEILFHRFKIELRDTILATLNDGIARAGKKIGFEGELKICGMPTVRDTLEASEKLKSGQIAFTEVMDAFD